MGIKEIVKKIFKATVLSILFVFIFILQLAFLVSLTESLYFLIPVFVLVVPEVFIIKGASKCKIKNIKTQEAPILNYAESAESAENEEKIINIYDTPQASAESTNPEKFTPKDNTEDIISYLKAFTIDDAFPATSSQNEIIPYKYIYPPIELLKKYDNKDETLAYEVKEKIECLIKLFKDFNVPVIDINANIGFSIIQYAIKPAAGVRVNKILNLRNEIAMALASPIINTQSPIPNQSAIGIEVANPYRYIVSLLDIIETSEYKNYQSELKIALGMDVYKNPVYSSIPTLSPLLIGGTTGSGKSNFLHSIIVSLLFNSNPETTKLLLIDSQQKEFQIYNGIPHLLVPVISDLSRVSASFEWLVNEINMRYQFFSVNNVKNIEEYNRISTANNGYSDLPTITVIIDDLADIIINYSDSLGENLLQIVQKGRTVGIYIIISTYKPSAKIVPGIIKAGVANRIAFALPSQSDSRTIIDTAGAEKLLGNGDMLFKTLGATNLQRIQCCYISSEEITDIVKYIKSHNDRLDQKSSYNTPLYNYLNLSQGELSDDDLLLRSIDIVVESQMASTTLLQRKFKIGYARAARIIDELENGNIIGPFNGSNPRKVLISIEQWDEIKKKLSQST